MRYQVLALDSEIGTAMLIETLGWHRCPMGDPSGTYNDFKVYMGLCSSDELGATFADNYIPGTQTLVYDSASQVVSAGADEWYELTLETPFWYSGQNNLIVEVQWSSASGSVYTYKWNTGSVRSVVSTTSPSDPTGIISTDMSQLMLTGTLELSAMTFAEVKLFDVSPGEEGR